MKYMLVLSLLLVVAPPAKAQRSDSLLLQHDARYFLQKSRQQNTAGWIFTSAGVVSLGATFLVNATEAVVGEVVVPVLTAGQESYESRSYTGFYLLSLAMIGTGIVFFATAHENKKRAISAGVSFKMETLPIQHKGLNGQQHFPAVGVRVPL